MHGLVVVVTRLKTREECTSGIKKVVRWSHKRGGRINGVFPIRTMYERFAGPKKVVVITRWSY